MSRLIDAYDSYNDFCRDAFFTICYEVVPSNLSLKIPLKDSKENIEAVISLFNFAAFDIKPVFKTWKTEDAKNTDLANDYPYEYLFKSEVKKVIIWITLDDDELFVDFLYDLHDPDLEAWIVATNHTIRTNLGELKRPTFKILSRSDRSFYTEDVNTGNFDPVDIEALYNEDFKEINSIIVKAITEEKSGLILLHGEPGTGKTSYIKNLISLFDDKNFIFVQNEFVQELLKPEFISFLLKHRNSLLIIEDAEKIISSRESTEKDSVVSTILQLTDGLFSDYLNIKVICTFNSSMEKVDKALLRKGRMIANYKFRPLSKEKSRNLSIALGFEPIEKEMTLADLFKLKERDFTKETPRKIGF